MNNVYTYENKKGFTLVELLAVIVIIALLITVAAPVATNLINDSKKSSFGAYVDKIYQDVVTKYESDVSVNSSFSNQCVIYDIEDSLGLAETGDNKGYVLVYPSYEGNKYYLNIHNSQYMVSNYEYNSKTKDYVKRYVKVGDEGYNSNIKDYALNSVGCLSYECVDCKVGKYDNDGNLVTTTTTAKAGDYIANLIKGSEFRNKMSSLISLDKITKFKFASSMPQNAKTVIVSTDDSPYPVYLWNVDTVVYYYSKADKIYLNAISAKMFMDMSSLTEIDLINFNTDNVTRIDEMFRGCSSLTSLDLSKFNVSKVSNLASTFDGDVNLVNLDISTWRITKVTNMQYTFKNCKALTGTLDLSNWSFESLNSLFQAFYYCCNLDVIVLPKTTSLVTNMGSTFTQCTNLKRIENIENFDASHVTKMGNVFKNCYKLESLDLSKWVVTDVDSISWGFQNCYEISELDLTGFNFSKVTSMSGVFYGCSNLKNVKFGNRNFVNVTTWDLCFVRCNSLEEIDLSNANLGNTTKFTQIVTNSSALKKVNLSNVSAPVLTDMSKAFYNCQNLEELNLTGFFAPSVENMSRAFYYAKKIKVLDLSGFDFTNTTEFISTFAYNEELETIYVSKEFTMNKLTEKDYTFSTCTKLKGRSAGGISYSKSKISADYAKVNGGYFTIKA